jgi:hypothetical protein
VAERDERVLDNPDIAYEREDISLIVIGIAAIVIFVSVVGIPLVLRAFYPRTVQDVERAQTVVPPAPDLQTDEPHDLRAFRAAEEARLNGYGWVDRGKGIVRIPLHQAMKDAVVHGIDGFPKAAP